MSVGHAHAASGSRVGVDAFLIRTVHEAELQMVCDKNFPARCETTGPVKFMSFGSFDELLHYGRQVRGESGGWLALVPNSSNPIEIGVWTRQTRQEFNGCAGDKPPNARRVPAPTAVLPLSGE